MRQRGNEAGEQGMISSGHGFSRAEQSEKKAALAAEVNLFPFICVYLCSSVVSKVFNDYRHRH